MSYCRDFGRQFRWAQDLLPSGEQHTAQNNMLDKTLAPACTDDPGADHRDALKLSCYRNVTSLALI
jgi:hypothetical protein